MGQVTDQELRELMARVRVKQITDPPPEAKTYVIEELTRKAQGTFDKAEDQAKAQAKAKVTAAKGTTLVLARDWPKRVYPLRMNRRGK